MSTQTIDLEASEMVLLNEGSAPARNKDLAETFDRYLEVHSRRLTASRKTRNLAWRISGQITKVRRDWMKQVLSRKMTLRQLEQRARIT